MGGWSRCNRTPDESTHTHIHMHAYEMMDKQMQGLRTGSDDLNRSPETPATEPLTLPLSYTKTICKEGIGKLCITFHIQVPGAKSFDLNWL